MNKFIQLIEYKFISLVFCVVINVITFLLSLFLFVCIYDFIFSLELSDSEIADDPLEKQSGKKNRRTKKKRR